MDTIELARLVRLHAVQMTHFGRSSHVGSVLSIADILAVLYGSFMNVYPDDASNDARDRFILSKGHAGAGVYAVLAECGFFSAGELVNHYQNGSLFSGHVSHYGVPGVEFSTGSLGHGLSVGVGMAIAAIKRKRPHSVHVLLSDGECDEGSNWEAILFAPHHRLSNLTVSVDFNGLQSLEAVETTLALEPFVDKWHSFGWHVQEVDGHNHTELAQAYENAKLELNKPSVVICRTIKGKGVSFMENSVLWHYRSPQGAEYEDAISELSL